MAEEKKSFVAYSDWYEIFKELPDEQAGILIKHIFSYVNKEKPEQLSDWALRGIFAPIKNTLKRDKVKWDKQKEQRSKAGKKSAEKRAAKSNERSTESNERSTSVNETVRKATVSDSVSVSVNVTDNEYKNKLLSEIEISDFPNIEKEHLEITLAFYNLFIKNLKSAGASTVKIEKAKGTWIDSIRLCLTVDGYQKKDLIDVYNFLYKNLFWQKVILSTSKLREKMDQLKMEIKNNGDSGFSKSEQNGGSSLKEQVMLRTINELNAK